LPASTGSSKTGATGLEPATSGVTVRGANAEMLWKWRFLFTCDHRQVTVSIFECVGESKLGTEQNHRPEIIRHRADIDGADGRSELIPAHPQISHRTRRSWSPIPTRTARCRSSEIGPPLCSTIRATLRQCPSRCTSALMTSRPRRLTSCEPERSVIPRRSGSRSVKQQLAGRRARRYEPKSRRSRRTKATARRCGSSASSWQSSLLVSEDGPRRDLSPPVAPSDAWP
jgi:hypothetical protein